MDATVVIPAYNAARYIEKCLQGLRDQTFPSERFEIILVDDGSSDQTADIARRQQESLPLSRMQIVRQPNGGPAKARNHGIRLASSDIIAFLDSDCVPQAQWLENLVKPFLNDPALAGVEGKTLPASDTHTILDHFIDNPHGGFYWTCNMAYRRSFLVKIGGFDEGFPLPAGEDIDIAHRMRALGSIQFAPDAVVRHLILKRSFRQHIKTGRTFSAVIRLHRKHPGLLCKEPGFRPIFAFQMKQILFPIVTRRREFLKAPMAYAQFCLIQLLIATQTLLSLPAFYREAHAPLETTPLLEQPS